MGMAAPHHGGATNGGRAHPFAPLVGSSMDGSACAPAKVGDPGDSPSSTPCPSFATASPFQGSTSVRSNHGEEDSVGQADADAAGYVLLSRIKADSNKKRRASLSKLLVSAALCGAHGCSDFARAVLPASPYLLRGLLSPMWAYATGPWLWWW